MTPIPLLPGEAEILVDLNAILHELYASLNYEYTLNYRREADPPLTGDDARWADELLREAGLR
jgi:hypothetical protein